MKLRDQGGFAMITAVMVSFVVLVLGIGILSLAMHNTETSGYDRRRVQAIDAAEAGVDYYFSYLQSTGGQSPACSVTKTLTTSPPSTFTVTPTFYDAAGSTLACPLASGVIPAAVLVKSVGTTAVANPARTMEAYAKLSVTAASTFDNSGAIFGSNSVTFQANANVGGNQYSDADLYTNGNLTLAANSILYGKVYAQGNVDLGSNSEVRRDVWANGSISLGGGSRIRANATSSTSSITLKNNSRIYGDAKAATTVTGGTVDGYRTQNTPTPPPPSRPYPTFTYVAADWQGAGYTVHDYTDCTTPLNSTNLGNWWGAATGTSHVIHVTGGCTMNINTAVTAKGNLAIISDGSVNLNTRITPASGTGPWNLYFFVGLSGTAGCQMQVSNQSGVDPGIATLFYTPQSCTVTFGNNSSISTGQVMGGSILFKHTISFQFQRLPIPGGTGGGFKQDVVYKREVITSP